ncbi:MAG: hypothetical protein PVF55_08790, partial [Desulfobacterales bacterium]
RSEIVKPALLGGSGLEERLFAIQPYMGRIQIGFPACGRGTRKTHLPLMQKKSPRLGDAAHGPVHLRR